MAVGIIIVEGPTSSLQFSAAERVKVVAEVQNGLSWLGTQSGPGGIRWVYDIRILRLDVKPGSSNLDFGQKEARWRDPAMAKLGYPAGMGGVQSYVNNLRASKKTHWAYCAFFTKYPVGHFAYASIGGPRLVMHYDNDGWGPDNIDRVFAHETGHVFGAPDEYSSSNCNCGGAWGYHKAPNGNCQTCASGGGVNCIMRSNSWEMCSFTPRHLGFPMGARYTGVFTAGTGAHALWVNADWNHFVGKWKDWSKKGLRLEDVAVVRVGGKTRYGGVFRAGNGKYGLWGNASWNSFQHRWQQWSQNGMRLVDLAIVRSGGSNRYTGVFRGGSGSYGLWVNASYSSFRDKWMEWSKKGLRLVDIEVLHYGGKTRYSGVFKAGGGGYGLWANASWGSFVSRWQQWSQQGLRLVDMTSVKVGGQTRYSGVFRTGAGKYGLWVNADWTHFRQKWVEWSQAGMRLVDFEVVPTGVEAALAQEALGPQAGVEDDQVFLGAGDQPIDPGDGEEVGVSVGFGAAWDLDVAPARVEESSPQGYGAASFAMAPEGAFGPRSGGAFGAEPEDGFGSAVLGTGEAGAAQDEEPEDGGFGDAVFAEAGAAEPEAAQEDGDGFGGLSLA